MPPVSAATNARSPVRIGRRHRQWVVAELDARGQIDEHAAMCLRIAIDGARAGGAASILIDLRDLVAIDAAALRLLSVANAGCRADGVRLGVLLRGDFAHAAIVHAFAAAGLVEQLQFGAAPSPSAPAPPARARTGAARGIRAAAVRSLRPQVRWPWRP